MIIICLHEWNFVLLDKNNKANHIVFIVFELTPRIFRLSAIQDIKPTNCKGGFGADSCAYSKDLEKQVALKWLTDDPKDEHGLEKTISYIIKGNGEKPIQGALKN
ncbi:hypothetical protein Glove_232g125 [Diversispora epigaea]|uniref:Uncharacterized protein n=1 Tax=Diversispora epigaea TaxID=1348612 RepID=A0A397IKP6_9GLOM|nr:hypothetical protein Glove_232g125 [Diversispora epigaea]